jgi:hypothetical protein
MQFLKNQFKTPDFGLDPINQQSNYFKLKKDARLRPFLLPKLTKLLL